MALIQVFVRVPKHGDWHTNSRFTACNCLQSFALKNIKFSINRTTKTGQLLANTGRAAATGAMYGGISGAGRRKRIQPKSTK